MSGKDSNVNGVSPHGMKIAACALALTIVGMATCVQAGQVPDRARHPTWKDPDTGYTWMYSVTDDGVEICREGQFSRSDPSRGAEVLISGFDAKTWVGTNASCMVDVAIPSAIDGKPVVRIGEWAFALCTNLTSVTIPASVTSIGGVAFAGCSSLTNVAMSSSITNIGFTAFSRCSSLPRVSIPDGVTSIQFGVFQDCRSLTSMTIPRAVTNIDAYAFLNCGSLTNVTIPAGVTGIGWAAFCGCRSLKSVAIPDSVKSIGYSTGLDNYSVAHLADYGKMLIIGAGVFAGCDASLFDTTTIPGVKLVDGWACGFTDDLSGDVDLTGVRGIECFAFSGCKNLTGVTIPANVAEIGGGAFRCCRALTNVTIKGGAPAAGKGSVEGVREIGIVAFAGCTNLTRVTIPASVARIDRGAFHGCGSLANVTFLGDAPAVGEAAFENVADGCTVSVRRGSTGWGAKSRLLGKWNGMAVEEVDAGGYGVRLDCHSKSPQ
jgi:hypothetical protein